MHCGEAGAESGKDQQSMYVRLGDGHESSPDRNQQADAKLPCRDLTHETVKGLRGRACEDLDLPKRSIRTLMALRCSTLVAFAARRVSYRGSTLGAPSRA